MNDRAARMWGAAVLAFAAAASPFLAGCSSETGSTDESRASTIPVASAEVTADLAASSSAVASPPQSAVPSDDAPAPVDGSSVAVVDSSSASVDEPASAAPDGETAAQGIAYTRYVNTRFGYAVDVPDFLIGQGEAGNSDGQVFTSADESATLTVYGSNMPISESATEAYEMALADAAADGRSVTYEAASDTAFTVSGYEPNGDIFFTRTWIRDGRQVTMDWAYRADMQPQVGVAIEHAEDTFEVARRAD